NIWIYFTIHHLLLKNDPGIISAGIAKNNFIYHIIFKGQFYLTDIAFQCGVFGNHSNTGLFSHFLVRKGKLRSIKKLSAHTATNQFTELFKTFTSCIHVFALSLLVNDYFIVPQQNTVRGRFRILPQYFSGLLKTQGAAALGG